LPAHETWTVFDYMNAGTLYDLVVDYFSSSHASFTSEQITVFDALSVALLRKVTSILDKIMERSDSLSCSELTENALVCLTDPGSIFISLAPS